PINPKNTAPARSPRVHWHPNLVTHTANPIPAATLKHPVPAPRVPKHPAATYNNSTGHQARKTRRRNKRNKQQQRPSPPKTSPPPKPTPTRSSVRRTTSTKQDEFVYTLEIPNPDPTHHALLGYAWPSICRCLPPKTFLLPRTRHSHGNA
ncbi:MAG: hypothetical protein AAGJ35_13270, partial [Myxococcota bacterium]